MDTIFPDKGGPFGMKLVNDKVGKSSFTGNASDGTGGYRNRNSSAVSKLAGRQQHTAV